MSDMLQLVVGFGGAQVRGSRLYRGFSDVEEHDKLKRVEHFQILSYPR